MLTDKFALINRTIAGQKNPITVHVPDGHFQGIERVLQSKIRVDLVNLLQQGVDTGLPRVCQHDKLYPCQNKEKRV